MMKLKAMVQIEVTLTDDEWQTMVDDYQEMWGEEIKAGEAEEEMLAGDAWNSMLSHGDPEDFEITWDRCTGEDFS